MDAEKAILIEEAASGQEWGMDIMNDLEGRFMGASARRKVAMRSGETDVAEVVDAPKELRELAKLISEATRHPGNMDIDVFVQENPDGSIGELHVLEMNARFGGGYPFSHVAGVNLPAALVSWLRGESPDKALFDIKRPGTYMKDITIVNLHV
jgi:carbamoyl-phosphate synthase large subunit